jgi:cytochrome P450
LSRKAEKEFSLFQLYKPEVIADPYPLYARIRDYEPVHWDPFLHSWVVTSYAEVVTVLTKFKAGRTPTPERMAAMGLGVLGPYAALMLQQILFLDAPDHTRLRSLCAVAFTPKAIAHLREGIQRHADILLDAVVERGQMDIVTDFANPFPALILAALLGLPSDPETLANLRRWAAVFGELVGNFEHDPDRIDALAAGLAELKQYITAQIIEQQTRPREGLIATLLAAEVDGARLTFDEIVANTILMIGGGLDESTNLVANGMLSLLQRPAALANLRDNPEILPTAIEELLRYEATTQYTGRIAPEDTELGGKTIRKGDSVTAVLAAANRDPARFPAPDVLNLTRTDNRHVSFSWASHYCLGAPLVRMSAGIAFSTLLRRLPGITLATSQPEWRGMAAMRAVKAVPVQFQPTSPEPRLA